MARGKNIRRPKHRRNRFSLETVNQGMNLDREQLANHMTAYRGRMKAIDVDFHNKFPVRFAGVPAGKHEVNLVLEDLKQRVPRDMCITLVSNLKLRVQMFLDQRKTNVVMIEENHILKTVRRSIVYKGRSEAYSAFKGKRIAWVERI